MLLNVITLIGGLAMILFGANALTDGASAIARSLGLSDLIIGLTIVAFGTSAPELVISIVSAINGSGELAIGNVVGSNIFNILMIIGITAIVLPIKIERSIMTTEIPLVLLSSIILLIMGNGVFLTNAPFNSLSRIDGLILLCFLAIFMRYMFGIAKSSDTSTDSADTAIKEMSITRAIIYTILGLVLLIFGGDLFVEGASGIASGLGVSNAIIGLTIVALGTSLPELATSVTAALKNKPGMAVGNVIGSNIFNIFLVLGCASSITPLSLGNITNFDLLTLILASLLFWLFGWFVRERTITRIEGAILVIVYIVYTSILILNA
jgi:cation:H+ antiporter